MNLKRKIIFILLAFLAFVFVAGSFGSGLLIGYYLGESQCPVCKPEEVDFSLFWEAYHKLQEKFVNEEKFDIQKMIYGAISGMVKSLEDPYTIFLSPEETKRFEEDVKGIFEGVGMEIGIKKNQLQVIAPLEGTPAQKAGLRAGDKILKIDDKPTIDITIEEAINLIRGPKGTEVRLTIFREDWEESKEFKITRAMIEIPSLKWEIKDNDIAYLKLYHFSEKARSDFHQAALKILNSPAKKIILDLRNNPGGYLEVAQDIAGWFLKKGNIVVIEDFGGKREQKIYKSKGPSRFVDYPMVILINAGSASGSEILAGALRDNRNACPLAATLSSQRPECFRIIVIGEKTFGKGSVQELEKLREGSLKITVARWLTPKGEIITDKGIEPDIKIEMTEKDYEQEKDPQLDKAIEIIKEMR